MNRAQRVAVLLGLLLGLAGLAVGFSGYSVARGIVACRAPLAGGGVDEPRPRAVARYEDGVWLRLWREDDKRCRTAGSSRQAWTFALLAGGVVVSLGGTIALREDGPG
jgi:hypothetical protein